MDATQVCHRGSVLSTDRGTLPDSILPPYFPRLTADDDEDEGAACDFEEPEHEALDEQTFPPFFFDDHVERKPPFIYCSALLHVCDEGVRMLRGLSFLTDDLLSLFDKKFQNSEKAKIAQQQLKQDICSEVLRNLLKHREILMRWENALGSDDIEDVEEPEKQLRLSAWLLCKSFADGLQRHSQTVDALEATGGKQSGAVKFLLKIFQKLFCFRFAVPSRVFNFAEGKHVDRLRNYHVPLNIMTGTIILDYQFRMLMIKRLGASLEQEESISEYETEMHLREKKAVKAHHVLEQQLEAERAERAEHYAQYQEADRKVQQDKDQSNAQKLALEQQLKTDCEALADQEYATFSAEEKRLSEQNTAMSTQLIKMQNDNRDKELSLRGKKSQSVEEVEALLEEYEQALATRKADLDILCREHEDMKSRINLCRGFFEEEARQAFVAAEAKRIAWEKLCERFLSRKRYYHAARKIQRAWRKHVGYEAKKKKSGGKKGKKGKKGKTKGKKKIEAKPEDLMPKKPVAKKGKKKGKK